MGRKETTLVLTILVNLLLIGLKFALAAVSGSLSLRASAWHSFSDVVVSLVVLVGLLLLRRGRAAEGASRLEHAISLLVGLFIFYVGFDIFREALAGPEVELRNVGWVALAAVITILLSYFMARYKTYVGRETKSPALVADGYHSLMDMYSSIVVVAGLFGYAIGLRSLDTVAAIIVVLFIALAGYEIVRDALAGLRGDEHHEHTMFAQPGRLLRRSAPWLALLLLAMYLGSGVYVVEPGTVGLVQRFGKLAQADVPPGLHYRLPWPIEKVTPVPVAAVQRGDVPASLMLSGDENLVNVAAVVHYRINDATAYAFNVADGAALVANGAEAALRQTVGARAVDALLTADKAAIQAETQRELQARLDAGGSGLEVIAVQLTQVSPPEEVSAAFLDVASAREDRTTYINEAKAYQNEILPIARGDAERQLREAEAYLAERTANATGEAARFASRLAAYRDAPAVTRTRLYLEALEQVLPGVPKFVISAGVGDGSLDLWFSRSGAALPAPDAPFGVPDEAVPPPGEQSVPPSPEQPVPQSTSPEQPQAGPPAP